jgi:hypothetical protein
MWVTEDSDSNSETETCPEEENERGLISTKPEALRFFCHLIKNYPLIFDLGHPDHKNRIRVEQAWNEIRKILLSNICEEVRLKAGLHDCSSQLLKQKLKCLEAAWRTKKRQKPKSGSGEYIFLMLQFLTTAGYT